MKTISKSRPAITIDLSEEGRLVARDIYGHPVPLRMGDALRDYFNKPRRHASQDPKLGTVMPDGTVYAGISPDTGRAFYTAAHDVPKPLGWRAAIEYARKSKEHDHHDWRVPNSGELNVLFHNRAAIGGFELSGSFPAGRYWSSSELYGNLARLQRFSDGYQSNSSKYHGLSVRCVRG